MTKKSNIVGIILQPSHSNVLFEGPIDVNEDGHFQGPLKDNWGMSEIFGRIDELGKRLDFRKKYANRGLADTIFYSFEKQGNIWVGSYHGGSISLGSGVNVCFGGAQCEIYDTSRKEDWYSRLSKEEIDYDRLGHFINEGHERLVSQGFALRSTNSDGQQRIQVIPPRSKEDFYTPFQK